MRKKKQQQEKEEFHQVRNAQCLSFLLPNNDFGSQCLSPVRSPGRKDQTATTQREGVSPRKWACAHSSLMFRERNRTIAV